VARRAHAVAAPAAEPRRIAGAPPLSNIDHQTAQSELDRDLFPHYVLGRQLALEETMRELILMLTPKQRAALADRLSLNAAIQMDRLTDGIEDPKDHASTAGYVATLLQQGF
jgi:hypothetical protein